jgi:DNA-binding transcriptional ArsR family regulator
MVSVLFDDMTGLAEFATEAGTLKLIGHPLRLRILTILQDNECNVKQIWETLEILQPILSQHLAILRVNGIIAGQRRGAEVVYSIVNPFVKRLLSVVSA